MSTSKTPPPIIDSARVIEYAHIGQDIPYTGGIHLIVDGERLGAVPNLAICRNYCIPDDILLLFCDGEWSSKGCIAFSKVEEAKIKAERGYPGISSLWSETPHDDNAVADFLRDVYDVDPSSEWWRYRCSFCQKDVEGQGISKGWATICRSCVEAFHKAFHANA